MWPFNSKRKKITHAFTKACQQLPRFTAWETLNRPPPQFLDSDGGHFTVVEFHGDTLVLHYTLGTANLVYAVSVAPNFLYVSSRVVSESMHRRFRREDALRFLEKLTRLLNAYAPA